MAHRGTLRTFRFNQDVDDIRGTDLYGRDDEKLGTIVDIIFDHGSGQIVYAVVDSGGWLRSIKFLVPADQIIERPGHDNDFAVDLSKDQVQKFPEYNERTVEDQDEFKKYEAIYREKWEEDPVLHKMGSFNIITPDPDEMPAATGSSEGADVTPTRLAGKFPAAAADGGKLRMRPAGTAADAEGSRLPGSTRGIDDGSVAGKSARDREPGEIGYGGMDRTAVPAGTTRDLPPSYGGAVEDPFDPTNDLHRPYPVQEGRNRRWAAFEQHLRRNHVDVTSTCRACATSTDKAA